jgi:hypothetical protein
MRLTCKECNGAGEVVFTKERGGPKCNNCAGVGYIARQHLEHVIGAILDSPSIYMSGPSPGSLRRAKKIVDYLEDQGLEV